MQSGHKPRGNSAHAMYPTHCAACDGLDVSVPSDSIQLFLIYERISSGICSQRSWNCVLSVSSFE
jgi:hypothetical protein